MDIANEPDEPTVFAPPAPRAPDAKTKRNALIQGGVALVILVFIFGFVLLQVINYKQVGETIKALEPWQIGALVLAGLITYIPEGWLYALLVPVLRLRQGMAAWIASTGVASMIPAVDLVVRFGMYRSWKATSEGAMLGIVLSGVFDNIVRSSDSAAASCGSASCQERHGRPAEWPRRTLLFLDRWRGRCRFRGPPHRRYASLHPVRC